MAMLLRWAKTLNASVPAFAQAQLLDANPRRNHTK